MLNSRGVPGPEQDRRLGCRQSPWPLTIGSGAGGHGFLTDIWSSGAFHYGILHFLFLSGRRALGLGLHDAFSFLQLWQPGIPEKKSTTAPSTSNKMEEKRNPKSHFTCHLRSMSQFKISVGISLQLQPVWNLDIPSPQVFLQKGLKVLIISQLNSVYMCKRRTEALVHSVGLFPKSYWASPIKRSKYLHFQLWLWWETQRHITPSSHISKCLWHL